MSLNDKFIRRNKLAYFSIKIDLIGLILISVYNKWIFSGMSFSQILVLQGLFGLFILLAEFPSGILADKASRKTVLILGQFCLILGVIMYFYSYSYPGFLLAELFFAIGLSFKSGTDDAFAYDSYLSIQKKQESDHLIARGQQLMLFGNIFMLSLGGLLTAFNESFPFTLAIFGYLLTFPILLLAKEPLRSKFKSGKIIFDQSIKLLSKSEVFQVLVMLIFVNFCLKVAFWSYIPQLTIIGVNASYFGFILGGANLIAFIASLWAKKLSESNIIILIVPIGVLGLLIMSENLLYVFLLAIVFHQISRGFIRVISSINLNRNVNSEVRASIVSLVSTISFSIYFTFSLLVDFLGLSQLAIIGVNSLIGIILLSIWLTGQINLGKKSEVKPVSLPL